MNALSLLAAGALATAVSAQAQTVTLLDLINPPRDTGTGATFTLPFTATSSSTTLSSAGYGSAIFTSSYVRDIAGVDDLLGRTWAFTPSPLGAHSDQQAVDSNPVNALWYDDAPVGSYDTYSQTFATKPGETYVYKFNVIQFYDDPSGFRVTVSPAVPEPGSGALVLAGLGLLGWRLRRGRSTLG